MDIKPIEIKKISKEKFNAYALFTRQPEIVQTYEEIEYYSNKDETILGVLVLDNIDLDFSAVLLCPDEIGRYRAFDLQTDFNMLGHAREWLKRKMIWHTSIGVKSFEQGDGGKGIDLFKSVVSKEKEHPYFTILNSDDAFKPAKKLISLMMPHFNDVDGNFVQQFQSTGFDARVWELFLFVYLTEEEFLLKRKYDRPDYIVRKGDKEVAIEAVIVGREKDNKPKVIDFKREIRPKSQKELEEILKNEMPIRFGSPLFSKLQKKYWNLSHVQGKPLIFAIADFHDDMSMTWSFPALISYLYGHKYNHHYNEKGELIIEPKKIDKHTLGEKEIPSGFFFQPEVENVSGILFSTSGTISKFNRLGRQAGFGDNNIKQFRMGMKHNHNRNADTPDWFSYEVNEDCRELWCEGVSIFHNPNAIIPIDKSLFPSIAHHEFKNGQIVSLLPDFYPYTSYTFNVKPTKE
ncbi:MAG: glycosaminoglycan attachment site [Bacteroidales bacterium]|nr:glycosaminoglycan attachment site [Bacteroidales bacterium]